MKNPFTFSFLLLYAFTLHRDERCVVECKDINFRSIQAVSSPSASTATTSTTEIEEKKSKHKNYGIKYSINSAPSSPTILRMLNTPPTYIPGSDLVKHGIPGPLERLSRFRQSVIPSASPTEFPFVSIFSNNTNSTNSTNSTGSLEPSLSPSTLTSRAPESTNTLSPTASPTERQRNTKAPSADSVDSENDNGGGGSGAAVGLAVYGVLGVATVLLILCAGVSRIPLFYYA